MFQFSRKLRYVKLQIKEWNTKVFKNIFAEKKIISEHLAEVNRCIIKFGLNVVTYAKQRGSEVELDEVCCREEAY